MGSRDHRSMGTPWGSPNPHLCPPSRLHPVPMGRLGPLQPLLRAGGHPAPAGPAAGRPARRGLHPPPPRHPRLLPPCLPRYLLRGWDPHHGLGLPHPWAGTPIMGWDPRGQGSSWAGTPIIWDQDPHELGQPPLGVLAGGGHRGPMPTGGAAEGPGEGTLPNSASARVGGWAGGACTPPASVFPSSARRVGSLGVLVLLRR